MHARNYIYQILTKFMNLNKSAFAFYRICFSQLKSFLVLIVFTEETNPLR